MRYGSTTSRPDSGSGFRPTRLTRQGHNAKVLAELLNAKSREINSFLSGQLASGRTQELQSELVATGTPRFQLFALIWSRADVFGLLNWWLLPMPPAFCT